jgi:hypothetical protein
MQADQWRQRWGLHTPETLRVRAQEQGASEYVIKGLLPARSIGILLGDSGLGKSPLMYQAGICVSAGVPFLGRETKKGSVVIAGFGRVRGEIGPLFLARDVDENGEPIGYRRLTGSELLFNDDQKNALDALPEQFSFKQAKSQYARADQGTANFLQRCVNLDLVRKLGRGRYEKVLPQNSEGDGAHGERA